MPPKAPKGEYIETDTGNKISRRSLIHGTQHIILGGKTVIQADAVIRGDLYRSSSSSTSTSTSSDPAGGGGGGGGSAPNSPSVAITIGRYSYISRQAILRPPSRLHRGVYSFYPLKIGDHVFVGERAVVEAATVGNHVHIGKDAVVGSMAILKDFVCVLDGAVVPGAWWCRVGVLSGVRRRGLWVRLGRGGLARERYRLVGR
ncbi:hypothetical protein BO83DRAFT_411256 [Aspergillus eucalypticola CBS 122712]|uniref:Dynactin subunit 5 n=1 Tax=Aspergillus eucalypticola (strain CBS 122712 / IBT 29274) TaxID=1448314 RepID=A0A317UXA3_ASPEC|nr:uncharacterized protein BO83DRAFT_411256 [Aspergillus eucalypticola CBS 122712]PWY64630.1 hypothetical protein BO83DRAFT_411256 [Aspergillus eucalypticola CBS 122712]